MLSQNEVGETYILNKIGSLCEGSFFPIHVECRDKSVDQDMPVNSLPAIGTEGRELWQNRYWYKLAAGGGQFWLWDTREAVLEKFDFDKTYFRHESQLQPIRFRFKGMPVGKSRFLSTWREFVARQMSMAWMQRIPSLSTVPNSRPRESAAPGNCTSRIKRYSAKSSCKSFRANSLRSDKAFEPGGAFEHFDLYAFWLGCTPQQRQHIPQALIERITDVVDVLVNTDSNKYQEAEKEIRTLIPGIETYTYIRPSLWIYSSVEWYDVIGPITENLPECLIESRKLFESLNTFYYVKSLRLFQIEVNNVTRSRILITWQDAPRSIQVSDAVRKVVLLSLREDSDLFAYERTQSTRRATFAIEGYEAIAVKALPNLISKPDDVNSAWMISPFTQEDDKERKDAGWSKEQFTAKVLNSRPFSLVVDWVEGHSLREPPPTRQEIIEAYQKLIGEYYDAAVEWDAKAEEND